MKIDIEGPAFSSVSFAHVVREIAFALEDIGCTVSIQATDKYLPGYKSAANVHRFDRLMTMVERKAHGTVKILYNFPVSMRNRCSGYNFAIVSWETTAAPTEWIKELNKTADQVWSISSFVNEAFLTGGLQKSKARAISMGVDPSRFSPQAPPVQLNTSKKFKFLHLGVAQARKGTPLLLKAYTKAFTNKDDVVLVVKSNGFGVVDNLINSFRRDGGPEILYVYEEAHEDVISGYYTATDCFVYPVHAEGAGLPVLESLACGRPVVVPLWSGLTDFCNTSNSFSVKHKVAPLKQPYSSYSGTVVETWAELSEDDLVEQLRFAYKNQEIVKKKGNYAASYINKNFTWRNTAIKILENINEFTKNKDVISIIDRAKTASVEPKIIKEIEISKKNIQRIGVLCYYENRGESYYYAKISLENSLSPTIGLVSNGVKDKRFIACIPEEIASPATITNICLKNEISILQIHWDRSLVPKHAFANFIKKIKENNIQIICCINDEVPDELPSWLFYMCRFFVVNSVRMRNLLIQKGCPMDRIKYVQPIEFKIETSNRDKTRLKYGIGTKNHVMMSLVYADESFSCTSIANEIKANISKMPHVKYVIYIIGGKQKEEYGKEIKKICDTAIVLSQNNSEKEHNDILAMADSFVMPYASKSGLAKNPALLPAINLNIPVVASVDCMASEFDNLEFIGSVAISEIPQLKINKKIKLAESKEYIKTMESIYYHVANFSSTEEIKETQNSIEEKIDVNKPIEFSEL